MKKRNIVTLFLLLLISITSIPFINGQPSEIILDTDEAIYVGTWLSSTLYPGYYGSDYRHHQSGTGANTATWSVDIPVSGNWEVFAWWSGFTNRATDAPYTITYSGGSTTVLVNQEPILGDWYSLGTYSFNQDTYTVSLSDDANEYVVADAIRLVYIEHAGYTIDFAVNGQGSIDANPPGSYDELDEVTVTATPSSGWVFTGWDGDLSGSENPTTVTMDAYKSIVGNFASIGDVTVATSKPSYTRLENFLIQIRDGTYNGRVSIQIDNPTDVIWFDIENLDSSGDRDYIIKIPSSWQDGTYTVYVKDFETKTYDSTTFQISTSSGGGGSGGGGVGGGTVLPPVIVIELLSPKDAANELENFPADDVAEILSQVEDMEHLLKIISFFDKDYSLSVIEELPPNLASQLLLMMDEIESLEYILAVNEKGSDIFSAMVDSDFNRSVLIVENGVKSALTLTEAEKTLKLLQLSKAVSNLDSPLLVELLVYIARLPETPSTVAILLDHMELPNVLDVVNLWILDESYNYALTDLATVFDFLSFTRVSEIYRAMSGEERIILLDYLSDNVITSLPIVGTFTVKELIVNPNEIETGDSLEISYVIENVGNETDDYLIPIRVNDVTQFTIDGLLNSGETNYYSHTISKDNPGTYLVSILGESIQFTVKGTTSSVTLSPAKFLLTSLTVLPTEIFTGDSFLVAVTLKNIGELAGTHISNLFIDSLQYEAKESYTPPGEEVTLIFDVKANLETGVHEISVMDQSVEIQVMQAKTTIFPYLTILTVILIVSAGAYYYSKRIGFDLNSILKNP